ncbi:hypothetical protein P43SY_000680 [Pythium insidiosum]|uniref:Peptidase M13 N-terminal domain-containing protein n=1 Tax=Pythium insidiosum TaxID=114742 RepID=A0AAD5Q3T2_PYTIN|nr:hypothetical protein P43SY_000680 [Pythium insidiosum]
MDVETIDKLGNKPLEPVLGLLQSASSKEELIEAVGELSGYIDLFTTLSVTPDRFNDSSKMTVVLGAAALPIENYRLYKDPEAWESVKPEYSTYVQTLLTQSGVVDPEKVEEAAASVMELERALLALDDKSSLDGYESVDAASGASDYVVLPPDLDTVLAHQLSKNGH